jgi:ABC-type transport system involved in multi-copper enzyme maturation permease subunit
VNPVLVKEFRTRMRGGRAFGVLLGYTLLLALLLTIAYVQWLAVRQYNVRFFGSGLYAEAGRAIFNTLFVAQALLIGLIPPAITSGAITIEREQRTLEMLSLTLLRPRSIILGKLTAATAFVTLLLTSSLPLVGLSFLLGGVSPGELFFTYLCLAAGALLFCSIGICWSATLRSTVAATAGAYATVGTLLLMTAVTSAGNPGFSGRGAFRSVNPIGAVFHSVGSEPFLTGSLPSWLPAVLVNLMLAALIANIAMARLEHHEDRRPVQIRLLATGLWSLLLAIWAGNVTSSGGGWTWVGYSNAREGTGVLLGTAFGILLLVAPLFTTGPSPRSAGDYLAGLLPHRLLAGDLASGAPLLGLWLALPFVIAGVDLAIMGHWRTHGLISYFVPTFLVAAVFLAAFIALGHALSALKVSRAATIALCYVIVIALALLPLLALSGSAPPDAEGLPARNLVFLSPLTAFVEEAQGNAIDVANWREHLGPIWSGPVPFWAVTTVFYLGATLVLVIVTLGALTRRERLPLRVGEGGGRGAPASAFDRGPESGELREETSHAAL